MKMMVMATEEALLYKVSKLSKEKQRKDGRRVFWRVQSRFSTCKAAIHWSGWVIVRKVIRRIGRIL
jgi:hypothetical protein